MLAGAAARAAKRLQAMLAGESGGQDQEQRIQALVRVIRVAHLRAKESPRRRRNAGRMASPTVEPQPMLAIDDVTILERRSA